jgi:hypothetical protein
VRLELPAEFVEAQPAAANSAPTITAAQPSQPPAAPGRGRPLNPATPRDCSRRTLSPNPQHVSTATAASANSTMATRYTTFCCYDEPTGALRSPPPTGVTLGRRRPLCGSRSVAAPQAQRIRSYSPHGQQPTAGRPSQTPGRLMRRQPAYDDLAAGQRPHVPDTPESRPRRPSPARRPVRAGHDDAARDQVAPPVYRGRPIRTVGNDGPPRRARNAGHRHRQPRPRGRNRSRRRS